MSATTPPDWMSPEEYKEIEQTLELCAFFARSMDLEKFSQRLHLAELAPHTDPTIDAVLIPHIKAIAAAAATFKAEASPHYEELLAARTRHQLARRRKLSS